MTLTEKILLIALGVVLIVTFALGFFSKNEDTDMSYLEEF